MTAPALTRDQSRSRRRRAVRATTINAQRLTKRSIKLARMIFGELPRALPATRAACIDGPRPCPYVTCQHHLYLDVSPSNGTIKLNFPDLEVDEISATCALDVADNDGASLEEVAELLNVTRERIRALLAEFAGLGRTAVGKRRLPVLADDEDDEAET